MTPAILYLNDNELVLTDSYNAPYSEDEGCGWVGVRIRFISRLTHTHPKVPICYLNF